MDTNKQSFQVNLLKCEKVVVFRDRAEVKRSLKVKLQKGENELLLTNVSNLVDQDSVRVEGHGEAKVLDVVCEKKHVKIDEADLHENIKKLQQEIKQLEENHKILTLKSQKTDKQLAVLHEYANTLSKKKSENSEKSDNEASENVVNFMNFLDLYGNRAEQLDNQKFQLSQEISELEEQLNVARVNLSKLNVTNFNDSNEITILIETQQETAEVSLLLSYVISNASWTPKYDIRVFSDNKTMNISYYGMISQSTGEDWNETQLSLSTAVPSIGGNVPELETLNVRVPQTIYYAAKQSKGFMRFGSMRAKSASPMRLLAKMDREESGSLSYQLANVQEGLIASTFDIPRQATIPADNNTHKVSIGIINLKPEFEYETVPKKTPHAFLKAKVKNTSSYAMLAGPANVFLDNNFVAKTNLKSYSPQEEFTCSLGVDPSIRVDYKPIKKYQEQSGLISKTRTTTYEQVIEIKNTSSNAVKLLLSDQLPLSNNEKIQVKLIEPVLKNSQTVKLNKQNNLEFDLRIPAGKQSDLLIKYAVEHNANEEIEFS